MSHRLAAIQMVSGPDVSSNLAEASRLIDEAVAQGAGLVVLPENFAIMGRSDEDKLSVREPDGAGPIQGFLAEQASRHGIWLVGGTIPLESQQRSRVYATCPVYDPSGRRVARYDKLHLFDVELSETDERYAESATIERGDEAVTLQTAVGTLGLAVCYDVRFPELFRLLLERGADLIALPAAFTARTGAAHWEVLVRARAIENLSYVIAADQGGVHADGRETYGDSMIVDPWGCIVDRRSKGPGVVVADLDRARMEQTRRRFPSIDHRRLHCASY